MEFHVRGHSFPATKGDGPGHFRRRPAASGVIYYSRAREIDETTRTQLAEELSRRCKSTVELQSLPVRFLPKVSAKGTGLILYFHHRLDVPPILPVMSSRASRKLTSQTQPVPRATFALRAPGQAPPWCRTAAGLQLVPQWPRAS